MEKILFYIFVSLVITVPLFYRIVRLGKVSWFVGKDDLETNTNFIKAERLRFIQINIGYLYFLVHGAMIWGWLNIITFVIISFFIGTLMEIIGTKTGLIFGGKYEFNLKLSPGPSIFGIPLIIPLS
ncbi:MAG: carotenoid biosynthesis protein, partial [Candidatus Neomarinimicrobiota bacterium]